MKPVKISGITDFVGKKLLLEAQKKGSEVTEHVLTDATAITLIGLAALLVERGVLQEKPE